MEANDHQDDEVKESPSEAEGGNSPCKSPKVSRREGGGRKRLLTIADAPFAASVRPRPSGGKTNFTPVRPPRPRRHQSAGRARANFARVHINGGEESILRSRGAVKMGGGA